MLCFKQPQKENMKKEFPIFHYIVKAAVKYKCLRELSSRIRLWDVFFPIWEKQLSSCNTGSNPSKEKRTLSGASSTSSFLSSQVVSNQVLSTYECLTTVFGMGTGGTTQLSPLDIVSDAVAPSKLYRRQEHFRVLAKHTHALRFYPPCGDMRRSTSANHAARFTLAFLGRFRIRPVTQSAFASWTGQ